MIRKYLTAAALFLLTASSVLAQKVRDREGDLAVLRGAATVNLQYSYEGMTVGKDYKPERAYMDENIDRLNEKRPGKGADWAAAWKRDRPDKLEPQFRSAFQDVSGIRAGDYPDARYTLIFHITHMESGYNIRLVRKSSFIDGTVQVVETGHPEQVLASFALKDCKGRSYDGYDFAANLRLMESFATAGAAAGRVLSGRED